MKVTRLLGRPGPWLGTAFLVVVLSAPVTDSTAAIATRLDQGVPAPEALVYIYIISEEQYIELAPLY